MFNFTLAKRKYDDEAAVGDPHPQRTKPTTVIKVDKDSDTEQEPPIKQELTIKQKAVTEQEMPKKYPLYDRLTQELDERDVFILINADKETQGQP